MYKRKRLFSVLLAFILLFSITTSSFATAHENLPPWLDEYDMRILHNGKYITSNPVAKILEDDTVLAPLRLILELSDYKVEWNKSGIVTARKGNEKVTFNSKKPEYKMEKIKGTILVDLKFFEQFKDMTALYDNTVKTIVVKSNNLKDDEVFDYNLGSRTMHTLLERDLTYTLNGGITVPNKDNSPLVIVMHGAHHLDKSELNRYDLGFSYLLRDLKENGYAAMAMNVGINYSFEDGEPMDSERINNIFEETLKELIKANKGEKNEFGIDLKNKLDLNNVILLGHSRSGQEIYQLANLYKNDDRFKISGLLAIAPARNYVLDYSTVDIPTGIILPQLDGDVDQLDGHWIFDDLIDNSNRKSESQLVYLYGGNHNAFNQAILKQDQGDSSYTGKKYILDKDKQKEFLKSYTKDFVKTVVNKESLYDNIKAPNENYKGYKAKISSFVPGKRVYSADDGIKNVSAKNAEAKKAVYSNLFGVATTHGFYPPGGSNGTDYLNILWTEKNGSVSFNIADKDTKDRDRLTFYLAQDSSDILNKKSNQQIKVTLVDKNNAEASFVTKKNEPSLKYVDGEILEETFYTTHTPLGFLDIPLSEFKNIDKDNLKTIRIDLTEKDSGALMIRHIDFN